MARTKLPTYRHHKPSGQAVVTLSGRDQYLGVHGSAASHQAYRRVIGEWLVRGGRPEELRADYSVVELLAAFLKHAASYYRRADGTPTSEFGVMKIALGPVKTLYGRTPAAAFGPVQLQVARDEMIRRGWARNSINAHTSRIRAMFKWASSNGLVDPSVPLALGTLPGLRAGRSEARETGRVLPVPEDQLEAVRLHLPPIIRAIVDLQLLTGARPGEILSMRAQDIDRTGTVWRYTPASHKNTHRGQDRTLWIGPKGQAVLRPHLERGGTYVFSPVHAVEDHRAQRRAVRKTPERYGNRPGTNRKLKPKTKPGAYYSVGSYRRAVGRACLEAFPYPVDLIDLTTDTDEQRVLKRTDRTAWRALYVWHPHQLRHNAATRLRAAHGLDGAQAVLGHASVEATQIYAERNTARAKEIAANEG